MKIADGIHRIGDDPRVNAYLVEEAGEVTIIDAAMPGFYDDIPRELAAMGRSVGDVRAIVLTHGHSDHLGFAERVRTEHKVPVWIHEADAGLARAETDPNNPMGKIRLAPLLGFLWLGLRNGGLKRPVVKVVSTYGDGATLDVPGSPSVTLVPGHTPGSAALAVPSRDALFVGDAFATYAVTTGQSDPRIAPFTADRVQALDSLARLVDCPAGLVLPGHGQPWTQGMAEAVRQVRASERRRLHGQVSSSRRPQGREVSSEGERDDAPQAHRDRHHDHLRVHLHHGQRAARSPRRRPPRSGPSASWRQPASSSRSRGPTARPPGVGYSRETG